MKGVCKFLKKTIKTKKNAEIIINDNFCVGYKIGYLFVQNSIIAITIEIDIVKSKIMMLRWMIGFIPSGIGFYMDLFCLSVKRNNA